MGGWLVPTTAMGLSLAGGLLSGTKGARQKTYPDPPEYAGLRDLMMRYTMDRLKTPRELQPSYETQGFRNINRNADLVRQSLENRMAAVGLRGFPVYGAGLTDLETRRFGDINTYENISLPQLMEDFYNQRLGQGLQLFNQRVPGVQAAGSAAGNALMSASQLLAYMYGSGAFAKS